MSFLGRLFGRGGRDPHAPVRLPRPDDMVLVYQPQGEPEAIFLQDLLRQNGIGALIKNRDALTAQYNQPGPAWAYELWVLQKHAARARALLAAPVDEE